MYIFFSVFAIVNGTINMYKHAYIRDQDF